MEAFLQWLTPGLVVAVYAALRADLRGVNARIDDVNNSVNARIDNAVRDLRTVIAGVNTRIDAVLLADRNRPR